MAEIKPIVIAVNEVEWKPIGPGRMAKALWDDPESKRRVQIARFDVGATLPLHRHLGDEILYVIQGSISDDYSEVTAGNAGYRPDGCTHTVISKHGALVFQVITGKSEPAERGANTPRSILFTLSELPWVGGLPGVERKPIWNNDSGAGRRAQLLKWAPGTALPAHRHTGDEMIFVIDGAISDEHCNVTTGNFSYRPNGCVHSLRSENGMTAFAVGTGGIEPV